MELTKRYGLRSAERTVAIDFDGYAVGGLSVGEDREQMLGGLDACIGLLPSDQPCYFIGPRGSHRDRRICGAGR